MLGEPQPKGTILNIEALASLVIFFTAYQGASYFMPQYAAPGIQLIVAEFVKMAQGGTLFSNTLATLIRIWEGLLVSFLIGLILGVIMGMVRRTERFAIPIVNFIMGIPALSWTLIAILWFRGTELRIVAVLLAVCFPVFAHSILDAIKGVSKELLDMTLSFRPTRMQLLQKVVIPSIVPNIITAWKLTVGYSVRVVIVAELVGASTGIGFQMIEQSNLLSMSGVLAWTMVLVVAGLIMQLAISRTEHHLLRWRPS